MKLKRLLARVEAFLNAEERQRSAEKKEIRKVLRKLKDKERRLRKEVADEPDTAARETLAARLTVVHAQRRKGLDALKAIKARR